MAAKTSGRGPSEEPLPELRVPLAEAERFVDAQLERGREVRDRAVSGSTQLDSARADYSKWVDYNRDLLRRLLTTDEVAIRFASAANAFVSWGTRSIYEQINELRSDIGEHVRRLESVRERLPLYSQPETLGSANQGTGRSLQDPSPHPLFRKVRIPGTPGDAGQSGARPAVFVVHGRDLAAVDRVVRLLRDLDLRPVVLREQPNQGRTIIEKFEAHAEVAYAVVLLTGDDLGGLAGFRMEEMRSRARQNVILELGFFIGRLGRKMVAALEEPGLERPSDIDGVLYIPFDAADTWRLLLAKEMKAAGLPIDLNRL